MSRCEHCGRTVRNKEDVYTYKGKELCEDCAVMFQNRDFSSTKIMGCDGPVGRAMHKAEQSLK